MGRNLVAGLARYPDQEIQWSFVVPADAGYETIAFDKPKVEMHFCPPNKYGVLSRIYHDAFQAHRTCSAFKPDVILGLGNFGFMQPPAPQLIMVQDSNLCHQPVYSLFSKPRFLLSILKRTMRARLRYTSAILTQTHVMADRMKSYYRFHKPAYVVGKVVSADGGSADRTKYEAAFAAHTSPTDFVFLSVSRYYAHKNFELIVEAFKRYPHLTSARRIKVAFTMNPQECQGARSLFDRIRKARLEQFLFTIGPVPSADLPSVYAHADGVLLPTKLESFSGNYIEGMRFERPILTTDMDFSREVCGDAALYFQNGNARDLAEKIALLAEDTSLRDRLVRDGAQQLKRFPESWDMVVEAVVEALRQHGRTAA